jgi:hypothetical protein
LILLIRRNGPAAVHGAEEGFHVEGTYLLRHDFPAPVPIEFPLEI